MICPITAGTASPLCTPGDTLYDQSLVAQVTAGDRVAQDTFVQQYRRLIYSVMHRAGVPLCDCEDMCQDVLVRLWSDDFRRLRLWRGTGRLSSFIHAVALKHVLDWARREDAARRAHDRAVRRGGACGSQGEQLSPFDIVSRDAEYQAVMRGLGKLSARDRTILIQRYAACQRCSTIARALGVSEGNAHVLVRRAAVRLRHRVMCVSGDLFTGEAART